MNLHEISKIIGLSCKDTAAKLEELGRPIKEHPFSYINEKALVALRTLFSAPDTLAKIDAAITAEKNLRAKIALRQIQSLAEKADEAERTKEASAIEKKKYISKNYPVTDQMILSIGSDYKIFIDSCFLVQTTAHGLFFNRFPKAPNFKKYAIPFKVKKAIANIAKPALAQRAQKLLADLVARGIADIWGDERDSHDIFVELITNAKKGKFCIITNSKIQALKIYDAYIGNGYFKPQDVLVMGIDDRGALFFHNYQGLTDHAKKATKNWNELEA
jgi:hypothetical protein